MERTVSEKKTARVSIRESPVKDERADGPSQVVGSTNLYENGRLRFIPVRSSHSGSGSGADSNIL